MYCWFSKNLLSDLVCVGPPTQKISEVFVDESGVSLLLVSEWSSTMDPKYTNIYWPIDKAIKEGEKLRVGYTKTIAYRSLTPHMRRLAYDKMIIWEKRVEDFRSTYFLSTTSVSYLLYAWNCRIKEKGGSQN